MQTFAILDFLEFVAMHVRLYGWDGYAGPFAWDALVNPASTLTQKYLRVTDTDRTNARERLFWIRRKLLNNPEAWAGSRHVSEEQYKETFEACVWDEVTELSSLAVARVIAIDTRPFQTLTLEEWRATAVQEDHPAFLSSDGRWYHIQTEGTVPDRLPYDIWRPFHVVYQGERILTHGMPTPVREPTEAPIRYLPPPQEIPSHAHFLFDEGVGAWGDFIQYEGPGETTWRIFLRHVTNVALQERGLHHFAAQRLSEAGFSVTTSYRAGFDFEQEQLPLAVVLEVSLPTVQG